MKWKRRMQRLLLGGMEGGEKGEVDKDGEWKLWNEKHVHEK